MKSYRPKKTQKGPFNFINVLKYGIGPSGCAVDVHYDAIPPGTFKK